jgi:GT2 family glycosyltransferase
MTEAPIDLSSIDFDRTSRHRLLADVVEELLPISSTILDIGGSEGLTARFLPEYHIVTLDLRDAPELAVRASAAALPFPDRSFDAVTSLDLLEHIPAPLRPDVLSEAARVTRELVVFAGPYEDPGVAEVEEHVQRFFVELFDTPNEWLEEHVRFGRPSFKDTVAVLEAQGLTISWFGSNPLRLWSRLQQANFVAARTGAQETHGEGNRQLFEELLGSVDSVGPSYRRFLVGTRSGRAPSCRQAAAAVGGNIVEWERRLETHLARVVRAGIAETLRYAAEMERGWKETVSRVSKLETLVASAMQEADEYRGRWQMAVEHSKVLAQGWREAAQQADTTQRTLCAYEQALFRNTSDWLAAVRGPAVTVTPKFAGHEPQRYRAWIASREVPAPPSPGPRFSILTPVFNPDSRHLEECIRSVRAQTYGEWQLVLANVSSAPHVAPICRRFSLTDDRLTVVTAENVGIAANTALAAEHATGEWLVFLDHDDALAPHALAAVAEVITTDQDVDFVYSDEDKLDERGDRVDPFFKPDWSPDLLGTVNYIGHLVAVRRSLYEAAGGLRDGFDGAQDYDFFLRATPLARKIVHIPDVLYHWRRHDNSTAIDVRVKPDAHGAGRRALQAFADRWSPGAWVDLGAGPTTHRLRYPLRAELTSIIIPFRDTPEMTDQCLQSLAGYFNELPYEVLLVSNESREDKTFALMEQWERQYSWARCLEYDEPFNFQELNNWAVRQTEGPLLLFLNNDTEALHDKWLDGLAEHAQRPEIGVVGPRLLYPNGLVQHAGVVVGIGGFADHPWAGLHPDAWTPAGPSYWVRNFVAVTAACLMIERAKFEDVGGFDERFTVCGGDVDLGLRLHAAGYRNVMTPFVRLIHHESLTRDSVPPDQDVLESLRSYAPYLNGHDPYYNVNLTLEDTSCDVRRVTSAADRTPFYLGERPRACGPRS